MESTWSNRYAKSFWGNYSPLLNEMELIYEIYTRRLIERYFIKGSSHEGVAIENILAMVVSLMLT